MRKLPTISLVLITLFLLSQSAYADPLSLYGCLLNAESSEEISLCFRRMNKGDATALFARQPSEVLGALDQTKLIRLGETMTSPTRRERIALRRSFDTFAPEHKKTWLVVLAQKRQLDIDWYLFRTPPDLLNEIEDRELVTILSRVDWSRASENQLLPLRNYLSSIDEATRTRWQWLALASDLAAVRILLCSYCQSLFSSMGWGVVSGVTATAIATAINAYNEFAGSSVAMTSLLTFPSFPFGDWYAKRWKKRSFYGSVAARLEAVVSAAHLMSTPVPPFFVASYVELARTLSIFFELPGMDKMRNLGIDFAVNGFIELSEDLDLETSARSTITSLRSFARLLHPSKKRAKVDLRSAACSRLVAASRL